MIGRFEVFTKQINKINRYIRQIKTVKTRGLNLTAPCVSCIYYLHKHIDGLTASELTELCGEDKAAISRTLNYLESNGLITCQTSAKKRYNAALTLTQAGQDIGKIVADNIDYVLEQVSVGVSDEEREAFYRTFAKISENLEKICKDLGEDDD